MDAAFLAQCKAYRAQVKANVARLEATQAEFGELPWHLRKGDKLRQIEDTLSAQTEVLKALDRVLDDLSDIVD